MLIMSKSDRLMFRNGVQAFVVLLGLFIILSGYLVLGVSLVAPVLFLDVALKSVKSERLKNGVNVLLLIQGITIWIVFITSSSKVPYNFDEKDALATRTHNILTRKGSNKKVITGGVVHLEHHLMDKHHQKSEDLTDGIGEGDNQDIILSSSLEGSIKYKSGDHENRKIRSLHVSDPQSATLIQTVFGDLPIVDTPELKYRTSEEVRNFLGLVFTELPNNGNYLTDFKNPCWSYNSKLNENLHPTLLLKSLELKIANKEEEEEDGGDKALACLPYAYILGQPKCGSSDLFERLKRHPDVRMPVRKEVRWFTRGEFTNLPMPQEGYRDLEEGGKGSREL